MKGTRVWENWVDNFFNEGVVVGRPQREELWTVVDRFKEVFAELPGRARKMCIRDSLCTAVFFL